MNCIFVANKPLHVSSNHYLGRLKRKYGSKKAGFSGTLDPFASGTLVVAFGSYTRLFSHLNLCKKRYTATLFLGAKSESLDIERVSQVLHVKPFEVEKVLHVVNSLKGEVEYKPPKFSAKKIDGQRAYKLAREEVEFEMKSSVMTICYIKLLNYSHPFVSFEVEVSKGAYVRSIGELIASKLGCEGALSYLKRTSEGALRYENEKFLSPKEILNLPTNSYLGDIKDFTDGKVLDKNSFTCSDVGVYFVEFEEFFSVVELRDDEVIYILNRMEKC